MQNKIDHISKNLPYQAPYSYFEHLPQRTLDRMSKSQWRWSVASAKRWGLSAAFTVMLLLAGWWFLPRTATDDLNWQTVATSEMADYLFLHSEPLSMLVMAGELQIGLEEQHWMGDLTDDDWMEWVDDETLNLIEYEL